MIPGIKLVVFDVSGVLRDSSRALDWSYRKAFERAGVPYPFLAGDTWRLRGIEEFHHIRPLFRALIAVARSGRKLAGVLRKRDPEQAVAAIISEHGTREDGELIPVMEQAYEQARYSDESAAKVRLFPGLRESLARLRAHYALAIFTNSRSTSVSRELAGIDLGQFAAIRGKEHAAQKPSGEGITMVCSMLGIPPKETLYVGDSVVDVAAARDAGCRVAVVLTGMGLRQHLEQAKPDFIFPSVSELADYLCNR